MPSAKAVWRTIPCEGTQVRKHKMSCQRLVEVAKCNRKDRTGKPSRCTPAHTPGCCLKLCGGVSFAAHLSRREEIGLFGFCAVFRIRTKNDEDLTVRIASLLRMATALANSLAQNTVAGYDVVVHAHQRLPNNLKRLPRMGSIAVCMVTVERCGVLPAASVVNSVSDPYLLVTNFC